MINLVLLSGMILILSPAKTLNFTKVASAIIPRCSEPVCSLEKTKVLADILKAKTKGELKTLMGVSDKIATTVCEYFNSYQNDPSLRDDDDKKPAVFAFDGPAYKGINAESCSTETLTYLQKHLRIIDPLYGALKPLDLIQPYRLEMATKGILKDLDTHEKSLANWWSKDITSYINTDLMKSKSKCLINLASDEYSAAIDNALLGDGCRILKISFQEEGKVVAVHAKRARGLMCRFIAENELEEPDGIKKFDWEGYKFVESSSDNSCYVFNRSKSWKNEEKSSSSVKGKRKNTDTDKKTKTKQTKTK